MNPKQGAKSKIIYCKQCGEAMLLEEERDRLFAGALPCVRCGAELMRNSPSPGALAAGLSEERAPERAAPQAETPPAAQQAEAPPVAPERARQGPQPAASAPPPHSQTPDNGARVGVTCPQCHLYVPPAYLRTSGGSECPFCGFDLSGSLREQAFILAQARTIFEHVSFREMFSLESVFQRDSRRLLLAFYLLVLGITPLAFKYLGDQDSGQSFFWFFTTYFSLIWGLVLYNFIKPRRFFFPVALGTVLLTSLIVSSGYILSHLFDFMGFFYYMRASSALPERLAGYICGVGLLEESIKALPVILFIKLKYIKDAQSACFYGVLSALAFSVVEGVQYSFLYARALNGGGYYSSTAYLLSHFIRYISLPLAHASFSGLACYCIGLSTYQPRLFLRLALLGIGGAAVLHGVYDTFCGTFGCVVVLGGTIVIFCLFIFKSFDLAERMELLHKVRGSVREGADGR